MLLGESFLSAADSLMKQKKRTVLTMLGFSLGIALFIVILSVGSFMGEVVTIYYAGIEKGKHIKAEIDSYPGSLTQPGFSSEVCNEFSADMPDNIFGIAFESESEYDVKAYCGELQSDGVITGVSAPSIYIYQTDMAAGRFITDRDCSGYRKTAVIPDIIAVRLFGSSENALQSEIYFKSSTGKAISCTIVGVYRASKNSDMQTELRIFLPYTTVNRVFSDDEEAAEPSELKIAYRQGMVSENNAIEYIYSFFSERCSDSVITVYPSFTVSEEEKKTVKLVTAMFAFISVIAFLVSGIGLTNTLLISVSERTHEIGIRKSIGAPDKVIKRQFLFEACIICIIACAFGILLGYAVNGILEQYSGELTSVLLAEEYSYIIARAKLPIRPPASALVASAVISLLLGWIFGGYPAKKAMRMQPADALRYE